MSLPDIPDEYGVANCLCSGHARPVKFPICPECGADVDELYKDRCGDIVGCENCVKRVDAWEVKDEES